MYDNSIKLKVMQPTKKNEFEQESNLFTDLLYKYLPYWPLFLILVLLTETAAWLYLRYKVPVYESSATILIKDDQKGYDNSALLQSLDLLGSKKIVENEIEVIHSRSLAQEVVKDLHLYAPVEQKGRLVVRSAYNISPVHIEVLNTDSIKEHKNIYFKFRPETNEVAIGNKNYPLNKWVNTDFGVLRFVSNQSYVPSKKERRFFFSLLNVKNVANGILSRLNVTATSKTSTVINLKFRDEVPQRGEDILNEWINAYSRAAINDKNVLAANTIAFIDRRLGYVVQELDSVEGTLQKFKAQNKIVDISAQGQMFLQSVGANDQKISDINMQLAVLDQVEDYVSGKTQGGSIVPSTLGISDPVLSNLLQTLYDTQLQYEKLKSTTAENNPMLVALVDQINKVKPSILENIQNQRHSLEAGRNDLYLTNSRYTSMLQTIPQKERLLLDISRQQSIKNNIYTFLLQKREETALSLASTIADSRLIDNADSTSGPVSPKRNLTYLVALLFALALGIGLIYFKEVINRNVLFRSEIEKYTSIPILSEIAYDNSKNPIVIEEGKRTFIAEQFRQLRTSLGYMGINSRKKKILVTSTISGEGKSFISSNLGISLALMGKKVVLIELDLRKPKLSTLFNVNKNTGISNYFIGDKEPDEIIKKTDINNNLFIIPSGPIPPNPSELIVNGKLQELFAYLETHFDYIIIDTAPISPVTDAYIISPLCDATLYVIRHGFTPRMYVQKLDEYNKINRLKNVAIVFNGVQARGYANYGYGYGYGYGYSYGYTEDDSLSKKKGKKSVKS